MTRSKDRYSQFDKSFLKDGTKIKYQKGQIPPRVWEGFLDLKGSDIKWETEDAIFQLLLKSLRPRIIVKDPNV